MNNHVKTTNDSVTRLWVNDQSKDDQAVLDWLSNHSFAGRQNDIFKRMASGTGDWLLKTEAFMKWQLSREKALWCPGIPGAGKTVLASYIVNHLKGSFAREKAGIAYVYCNYKEPNQTAETLVAALVRQLLQHRGSIPGELREM